MVQIGTAAMPIDDAVMPWDQRRSPYVKVATITVDRLPDEFDAEEMMQFGEHLSFTPWHALPDHKPLGSINAARRDVYRRISTLRHRLNKRPCANRAPAKPRPTICRSIAESHVAVAATRAAISPAGR